MAYRSNLAYETSPRRVPLPEQKPEIRRVPKKSGYIKPYKAILLIVIAVAITASMIYSRAQLNVLNDQNNKLTTEYQTQKSENVRLSAELDSIMSFTNVEQFAEKQLGLRKMDQNQVEYISVPRGNTIEIPEHKEPTFFEKIKTAFTNFVEYLAG
ncbi:putative cell division protein FtsL [[Clostridium] methylpentosum DSM 5476]|uniref:Putative cell division protein FtsL n=1 Tax=[Clostridium] methylpentosum DSM 5476 TaxID=537013 RepID=C0EHB4_9FIRM|nr:putative cell division protein FtsL [[Clostridium] methylpentosum DSM 5476]MDY3987882.1 cell division protein FtsL [Massilioclostridium sp.]MEE1490455.1 cell division protein FtsL [Massilioclostridium sp.]